MKRREFVSLLGTGVTAGSAKLLAQTRGRPLAPGEVRAPGRSSAPPPLRKATITKLFKTPDGHPNALDATADGLWIGEQVTDRAVLMDLSGKVLKSLDTECHNCSGLAVGGGFIWMSANGAGQFDRPVKIDRTAPEILQLDMSGKVVKRHDVPLGGRADVVVTDGFTGNVLLKGIEGAFALAGGVAAESAALRAAVLLGVPGTVVVCHGAATGADLASGLALAARLHRNRVAVGHTDPAPAGTMGNPGPERSGLGKSGPAGPARPANLPAGSTATEQAALSWRNR